MFRQKIPTLIGKLYVSRQNGFKAMLDLEKMVDTSDEWILKRTGIKERRIAIAMR